MIRKRPKIIIDTNVWISYLIGKRLQWLTNYLKEKKCTLITTPQLFLEIEDVTARPKLVHYFSQANVTILIQLLNLIGKNVNITESAYFSKDPKDSYLLDLIEFSKANYLITGDKDLLDLGSYKSAIIISPSEFEKLIHPTTP